ncbi:MAG: DUF4080 domain-containing protein [Planctomycetota bacterium]|nr:DUF4080 domain-containing protein [Planctomycetota bacterium]
MSDIVLAVLNARYSHTALGVRYLLANLGELREQAVLEEFLIVDDPQRIVERILRHQPRIVALSLSIWNVAPSRRVIALLKQIDPAIKVVVGGPEVRFTEQPEVDADVVVRGEGEVVFPGICADLLAGRSVAAIVDGVLPDVDQLVLPYDDYSDEDIRQRIIYVESSRGCPFRCEFCLSSMDKKVRRFALEPLLAAFERLIARGCRCFKFIDRTFNLDLTTCQRLLDFFYERWPRDAAGALVSPEMSRQVAQGVDRNDSFFLHFEMVPDRFDENLLDGLARFPAGGVQLEVGVQTLDPEAGRRISRRIDAEATARNIGLIRQRTGAHIHADLIVGLPGEDVAGFARSFDELRAMGPHEIQVGILKLLPGAPIARHVEPHAMRFNPQPPYDVLQTDCIPFQRMQELKRFARYHDVFVNSDRFAGAMAALMDTAASAFAAFDAFAQWVFAETGQDHAINQQRQYRLVMSYLCDRQGMLAERVAALLIEDFLRHGLRRYLPECLRPFEQRPEPTR